MKKTYSTGEVMTIVGIGRMTLLRWLKGGKIPEPKRIGNGGIEARIWTDRDVERVRKYKQENYRKGRGRKPKPKR
jgi:predicted DNA-binding transcriptional regulator AlpA